VADITFQFSSDEKDLVRGLQSIAKEQGKLRDQMASLVTASRSVGTTDTQLAQQRLKSLDALVERQKALQARMGEQKAALDAGSISAAEYSKAMGTLGKEADQLTAEMGKLNAEVIEDIADLKKASAVLEKVETGTEKYARAVRDLDRMKAKGILTSEQHARALDAERKKMADVGSAGDQSGGLISGLTGKMKMFVSGLASGAAVVALLRSEYEHLLELQGKSRDANITLAASQEQLLMNLGGGGADARKVFADIRNLSDSAGVEEKDVTQAVNEAMAARADLSFQAVLDAVRSVTKVRKFAPSEMAGLAGATIDTQKQTGLGTDAALGFLMQLQTQARTVSLQGLAENFTPAVGGMMQLGMDRQTAGAALAAMSHGMADITGDMTANAGIKLAAQLRDFGQSKFFEAERDRRIAPLIQEQDALRQKAIADFRARGEATPEQQAEHDQSMETLESKQSAARKAAKKALVISTTEVLEAVQRDADLRADFMRGQEEKGFGASFEVKTIPGIESLLSGGTTQQQFVAARQALQVNPLEQLKIAIAAREESRAMQLAELDKRFGNTVNQMELRDTEGAQSAIIRDRIQQIRAKSGTRIGTALSGVLDDVMSGGTRSVPLAIANLDAVVQNDLRSRRNTQAARFGGDDQKLQEQWRRDNAPLLLLLEELKKLREQQERDAEKARVLAGEQIDAVKAKPHPGVFAREIGGFR